MPNRPFPLGFQGESEYSDSSRPIYNMYSKIAEKEDNTMVKYYQKNTEGTLVYVSSPVSPLDDSAHRLGNIEWFILCHRCYIVDNHNPRPQAKPARLLRVLPGEHLSPFRQLECN